MMAGVAAAATGTGEGIAGAAWDASIIPVRVLDEDGAGFDDDIAAGIAWAADQDADVILLALGGPGDSDVLREAVAHATESGSVVVAAAGNDASARPQFPAAIPEVVAVSATDTSGVFAWFSSRGEWVDVAAPGARRACHRPLRRAGRHLHGRRRDVVLPPRSSPASQRSSARSSPRGRRHASHSSCARPPRTAGRRALTRTTGPAASTPRRRSERPRRPPRDAVRPGPTSPTTRWTPRCPFRSAPAARSASTSRATSTGTGSRSRARAGSARAAIRSSPSAATAQRRSTSRSSSTTRAGGWSTRPTNAGSATTSRRSRSTPTPRARTTSAPRTPSARAATMTSASAATSPA